jgi:hypothetical protein
MAFRRARLDQKSVQRASVFGMAMIKQRRCVHFSD